MAAKKAPDPRSMAIARRLEEARASEKWSGRQAGAGLKNATQYDLTIKSMLDGANPRTDTLDRLIGPFVDHGYRKAWLLEGENPRKVGDVAPRLEDDPFESEEAKKLEREFLPKLEARYPGRGMAAIRGLRARAKLRPYDLRTLWEALSDAKFEERGVEVTSLALINLAQGRVLDEGDTTDTPPSEKPPGRRKR
jgi:hypothetical protein